MSINNSSIVLMSRILLENARSKGIKTRDEYKCDKCGLKDSIKNQCDRWDCPNLNS